MKTILIVLFNGDSSSRSTLFHSSLRLFYGPDGKFCPKVGLLDEPRVANFPVLRRVLEVELEEMNMLALSKQIYTVRKDNRT